VLRLDYSATLQDPEENGHYGDHQQDVNETAANVTDHTQSPQSDENDCDCPEHDSTSR
jgi:hypothetical protein